MSEHVALRVRGVERRVSVMATTLVLVALVLCARVQAQQCGPGTHWNPNTVSCVGCPKGKYSDTSSSATSCSPCAAGSAASDFNRTTPCPLCDLGTFASHPGASACSLCGAGYVATSMGHTSCTLCQAGTVSTILHESCDRCQMGQYAPAGRSTCLSCEPGSYSGQVGQGACTACPKGTFNPEYMRSACFHCVEGKSSPVGAVNATQCSAASAGQGDGTPAVRNPNEELEVALALTFTFIGISAFYLWFIRRKDSRVRRIVTERWARRKAAREEATQQRALIGSRDGEDEEDEEIEDGDAGSGVGKHRRGLDVADMAGRTDSLRPNSDHSGTREVHDTEMGQDTATVTRV